MTRKEIISEILNGSKPLLSEFTNCAYQEFYKEEKFDENIKKIKRDMFERVAVRNNNCLIVNNKLIRQLISRNNKKYTNIDELNVLIYDITESQHSIIDDVKSKSSIFEKVKVFINYCTTFSWGYWYNWIIPQCKSFDDYMGLVAFAFIMYTFSILANEAMFYTIDERIQNNAVKQLRGEKYVG